MILMCLVKIGCLFIFNLFIIPDNLINRQALSKGDSIVIIFMSFSIYSFE